MKKILLAAVPLLHFVFVFAQTAFDVGLQITPRFEQRRGYQTLSPPDSKSAFLISERARLNVGFQAKHIKLFLALQDVRVWGDVVQTADVAGFGMHEGWAEIFINDSISFKLGRQEIAYDDHRLLGNLDWAQQARAHDAAVFKARYRNMTLHLGGAFNQASEGLFSTYYALNNYKALAYLWYNHRFVEDKIKISFYTVADGYNADTSLHINKVYFRGTTGPILNTSFGGFKSTTFFFIQYGKNTFDKDILAYFASAWFEYTIQKKVMLGIGYDFLSGNDASNTTDKRDHRFHTLYPTNHKFYGHMDYFLNIPKDSKGGGLQDAYFKINYMPCSTGKVGLDIHYFLSAAKLNDPVNAGEYLKLPLGLELDLYGSYKPLAYLEIKGGYSTMLAATQSLEALNKVPGGSRKEFAGWGWLQVNVNPTVFRWEKNNSK